MEITPEGFSALRDEEVKAIESDVSQACSMEKKAADNNCVTGAIKTGRFRG